MTMQTRKTAIPFAVPWIRPAGSTNPCQEHSFPHQRAATRQPCRL